MEYIEDNFNLILIKAQSSHSIDTTVQLTAVLRQYSEILYGFPPFERLACEMEELSLMFGTFDNYDKIEELLPQLSILFTFLEEWRKEIFIHQSIEDMNFMDKGIITIIEELKSHLS